MRYNIGLVLLVFLSVSSVEAESLPGPFACEGDDGQVRVEEEPKSLSNVSYEADIRNRAIIFYPRVALRRPKVIANLEFAEACLAVLRERRSVGVCESIRLLQKRGLFSGHDREIIVDYFISLPISKEERFEKVREVTDCELQFKNQ